MGRHLAGRPTLQTRWPHLHYRRALCAVLNADRPAHLGLYPVRAVGLHGSTGGSETVPLLAAGSVAGLDALDLSSFADPGHSGLCTPDRRQVVKLIAALVAAAVMTPTESDPVSVFGGKSVRLIDDPAVLAGHETIAGHLAALYRSADPLLLLPLATEYADRLAQHLDADLMTEVTVARLVPIVVGVHAQVGLWACHADRLGLARRYLAVAYEVAMAANDATLWLRRFHLVPLGRLELAPLR